MEAINRVLRQHPVLRTVLIVFALCWPLAVGVLDTGDVATWLRHEVLSPRGKLPSRAVAALFLYATVILSLSLCLAYGPYSPSIPFGWLRGLSPVAQLTAAAVAPLGFIVMTGPLEYLGNWHGGNELRVLIAMIVVGTAFAACRWLVARAKPHQDQTAKSTLQLLCFGGLVFSVIAFVYFQPLNASQHRDRVFAAVTVHVVEPSERSMPALVESLQEAKNDSIRFSAQELVTLQGYLLPYYCALQALAAYGRLTGYQVDNLVARAVRTGKKDLTTEEVGACASQVATAQFGDEAVRRSALLTQLCRSKLIDCY